MVGVSYHELTSNINKDARHSAGQRKQFLVICVLGVAVLLHALINAGILESVVIKDDGIYPGGAFIYKLLEDRDFATTGGIWRRISKDLQSHNLTLDSDQEEKYDEFLYSVYVDNVDSGFGRFFSGILIDESKKELKARLLAVNDNIHTVDPNENDAEHTFLRLKYEVGDLPSVRSAVATFPYTNGFVSALIHNYKVFPALYKYAKKHHDPNSKIIISTTCNPELKLCQHYVPMIKSEEFFMGHPHTKEYLASKSVQDKFDVAIMIKSVKKLLGFK